MAPLWEAREFAKERLVSFVVVKTGGEVWHLWEAREFASVHLGSLKRG